MRVFNLLRPNCGAVPIERQCRAQLHRKSAGTSHTDSAHLTAVDPDWGEGNPVDLRQGFDFTETVTNEEGQFAKGELSASDTGYIQQGVFILISEWTCSNTAFERTSDALSPPSTTRPASLIPGDSSFSPDGRYALSMTDHGDPLAIVRDNRALALFDGTRVLAQFLCSGSLDDVFWSKDGRWVAFNNRWANAGDRLWILKLADGQAIKSAPDRHGMLLARRAMEAFLRADPRADPKAYRHVTRFS